jgi:hypothetical protein
MRPLSEAMIQLSGSNVVALHAGRQTGLLPNVLWSAAKRSATASTNLTRKRWTNNLDQLENVLQELMSPLFKPAVSHFWRCSEEPWVKLSGTA